jgi:hypothetical protein
MSVFYPKTFLDYFKPPFSDLKFCHLNISLDMQTEGGASRWIRPSGWPNAFVAPLIYKGQSLPLLIAGENMSKDTPIRTPFDLRFKVAFWENPATGKEIDRAEHFLERWKVQLLEWMRPADSLPNHFVRAWSMCQLHYILQSPVTLLSLIVSGKTSAFFLRDLVNSLQNPKFKEGQQFSQQALEIPHFMNRILELMRKLESLSPEIRNPIKNWILDHNSTFKMMQLLKGIDEISKAPLRDVQEWEILRARLMQELPSYNWLLDEEAPLGLKRWQQDVFETYRADPDGLQLAQKHLKNAQDLGAENRDQTVMDLKFVITELKNK